jgi:phosphopantothenoylcysteine decarboxylase/phosphopantothenate--cysteine ligase
VADYRPAGRAQGKIKKGQDRVVLELVKNPDILEEIGTMGAGRVLVGFALEAVPPDEALAAAREKLVRKRCDLIVLNRTGSLGGSRGEDVVLVFRGGTILPLGALDKRSLAERIVTFCEELARGRSYAGDDRSGEGNRERAGDRPG